MVDIAMCRRQDCGKRLSCFRYLADAEDYYQSYIAPPKCGDDCEMYWRVRDKKELQYMNKVNR